MARVADPVATTCANCGRPLAGSYCAHCGEKALDPHALTVKHFLAHSFEELFHLDGRLWTTFRALITRPGFLSSEYAAGRRKRYVNPTRLLITAILAYALFAHGGLLVTLRIGWIVLSVAPTMVSESVDVPETVRRIDRFGVLAKQLDAKRASVDVTSDVARERFHARLNRFAQPLSFANVFLLALALYAAFRRKRPLLVHHAVFSMHLVTFVLLSSVVLVPMMRFLPFDSNITAAVILSFSLWQFAYMSIAIRRFYFGDATGKVRPRLVAVAAAIAVYIVNSAFLTAVQVVAGAIALRGL